MRIYLDDAKIIWVSGDIKNAERISLEIRGDRLIFQQAFKGEWVISLIGTKIINKITMIPRLSSPKELMGRTEIMIYLNGKNENIYIVGDQESEDDLEEFVDDILLNI